MSNVAYFLCICLYIIGGIAVRLFVVESGSCSVFDAKTGEKNILHLSTQFPAGSNFCRRLRISAAPLSCLGGKTIADSFTQGLGVLDALAT